MPCPLSNTSTSKPIEPSATFNEFRMSGSSSTIRILRGIFAAPFIGQLLCISRNSEANSIPSNGHQNRRDAFQSNIYLDLPPAAPTHRKKFLKMIVLNGLLSVIIRFDKFHDRIQTHRRFFAAPGWFCNNSPDVVHWQEGESGT
jgi:hypothetical protein